MTETTTYEQAVELMELLEDTVAHHCDENMMSGMKVWTMLMALAEAKLEGFPQQSWNELEEV